MRRYFSFAIALLILVFTFNFSKALDLEEKLNERWRWIEFGSNAGLTGATINDIIQTPDSSLYIVGGEGIYYYEDFSFHPILKNDSSKAIELIANIPFKNFRAGLKDEIFDFNEGSMFIVDKEGAVTKKIFANGKRYYAMDGVAYDNNYLILAKQENNEDKNYKLYLYDGENLKRFPMPKAVKINREIEANNVLFYTKSKCLWLNAPQGLYSFRNGKWTQKMQTPFANKFGIQKIVENNLGYGFFQCYFPQNFMGVWEFANHGEPKLNEWEIEPRIKTADINQEGEALIVFGNGKVKIWKGAKWENIKYPSFNLKYAKEIHYDFNGDLWVISSNKIYLCRLESTLWSYITFKNSRRNNINEIYKASDGTTWIASNKGLTVISSDGSKRFITKILGVPLSIVTAINEDENGNIWVGSGTLLEQSYKWDGERWKKVILDPGNRDLRVHKIRKDSENRLWFLTLSSKDPSKGYCAYALENGEIRKFDADGKFSEERIYDFLEDSSGAYWFATAKGVVRYKNGGIKRWNSNGDFPINKVSSLAYDKTKDKMFFSLTHQGAIGFIKDDSVHIIQRESMKGLTITEIEIDNNGCLWIATNGGVIYYNGNCFFNIDISSGLTSDKIWPLLIDSNKIYFGSSGGINILQAERVCKDKISVALESSTKKEGSKTIVQWKINSFCLLDLKKICSQYRIDGGEWSSWTKSRKAEFNDLSSGEHTFELRFKRIFDAKGKEIFIQKFELETPMYKNPWFVIPLIALAGVLYLALVFFYLKRARYLNEIKQSRLNLEESEKRYRYIIENANDGIVTTRHGLFNYTNPKAAEMLGINPKKLIGRRIVDFVAEEFKSKAEEIIERLKKGLEAPDRMEIKLRRDDRSEFWADARLNKVEYDIGYGALIIVTDIDERKAVEKKLKESLEEEHKLSVMKSSIISNISHQYRTPLTIVQTSIDLLRIHYEKGDKDKFEKNLSKIQSAIDRMIRFLEDILLLGKIESSDIEVKKEQIVLKQFCDDLVKGAPKPEDKEVSVSVECNIDDDKVETDPYLLKIVVGKILKTALELALDKSQVKLCLERTGGWLLCEIYVGATSIDKERVENLFEPFYEGHLSEDSDADNFSLAIAKDCADILGGETNVQSEGEKIIFTIKIPERIS